MVYCVSGEAAAAAAGGFSGCLWAAAGVGTAFLRAGLMQLEVDCCRGKARLASLYCMETASASPTPTTPFPSHPSFCSGGAFWPDFLGKLQRN